MEGKRKNVGVSIGSIYFMYGFGIGSTIGSVTSDDIVSKPEYE